MGGNDAAAPSPTRPLRRVQLRAQDVRERFHHQLVKIEGLGDEIVSAAQARLHAILQRGEAGEKDDGRGGVMLDLADMRAEFEAVHHGQIDVEQDEIAAPGREFGQSGAGIEDALGANLRRLHGEPNGFTIVRVIIDRVDDALRRILELREIFLPHQQSEEFDGLAE